MKRFFHSELSGIEGALLTMSQRAIDIVAAAIAAYEYMDIERARKVITDDKEIDQMEVQLDHEATRYLALRQPVARELRLLSLAIKTSHDLERSV